MEVVRILGLIGEVEALGDLPFEIVPMNWQLGLQLGGDFEWREDELKE